MKVYALGNTMDVPIEGLRFERDPFGLNGHARCDCPACELRRQIAARLGVPASSVVLQIAPAKVAELVGVPPAEAMAAKPAPQPPAAPRAPQVTAFDVHGCPQRPGAAAPLPDAAGPVELPRWIVFVLVSIARLAGWVCRLIPAAEED